MHGEPPRAPAFARGRPHWMPSRARGRTGETGGFLPLSPHRAVDRLLLLGRECDGRLTAVELLHVDACVVSPLDRGDDDTGSRRVEERQRGRLVAAGVLVRVVPHDRRVRERAVDPQVDPRKPRGDLVHGAVEVVDAALERDREVDDVLPAAGEQQSLRVAHTADADPREPREDERRDGDRRRARCDQRRCSARNRQPRLKMTGYVAELFDVFVSPGTAFTSTFRFVFVANGTCPRFENVTVFCSPGLMTSICSVFTIGLSLFSIVRVTVIWTSCESPESSIVTAKARSVLAVTVLSAPV